MCLAPSTVTTLACFELTDFLGDPEKIGMNMKMTKSISFFSIFLLAMGTLAHSAERYTLHSFQKIQLTDQFFAEGANYGDFNRDGVMDVVSGPYWYAGPTYTERHEYYAAKAYDINGYSDNFFAFTHDVDGDGWTDIIVVGFPGKEAWWFANPRGKPGRWQRHVVFPVVDNESPTFTDITGDDRPDLVFMTGGQLGYAEIPQDNPRQPWKFTPISPVRNQYQRFTHGLGVGDVNGDGRPDILEKDGWWEQPSADTQEAFWKFHEVKFSAPGGAQMYAYDIDGDGDNDVVTSKAAHAYGLAWFENLGSKNGTIEFKEHLILSEKDEPNEYGVSFSQLHALALSDMDGDGLLDVITGKRFWAHNGNDPGERDPAVLYWFQTVRESDGTRFVPHRIDSNSGVGTQVVVGDLNGDNWPDIVVGNKKGMFVFLHQAKEVDRQTWEAAQPKPQLGAGQPRQPRTGPEISSNAAAETAGEVARKAEPQILQVAAKPLATQESQASAPPQAAQAWSPEMGIPPVASDGRRLNLDFETGDLRDWKSVGSAFSGQPVKGDTVRQRRADSVSGHAGNYWIGTYEIYGDGLHGTLASVPFPVTHPWATFLVGGGGHEYTRVEVVRADTDEVIFKTRGLDAEEMRPVAVDLRPHLGKEIYLRLVDQVGSGWGHINFDHFRFHDLEPKVPPLPQAPMRPDEYAFARLPAEDAARAMKLPPGFSVKVCAAEPDVKQPIAMALDDRGRVWIAEAYEYPQRAKGDHGRDRILVFEDTDGDGRFDKRKVFFEGLNLVSGLEVGFGGVWVGAAPYFMFIPDQDENDVPDREPEILLDGWHWEDTHETLNSFIWGPDGWLYGCHGVFTHSRVGKPGTPDNQRVPLNAAIWRYHPTRHQFEVFAHGTSNPWGVDFDDYGQAFCTACVIPHLFHVIQGARYHRQAGQHFNPYTYVDIQTIADHRHYLGKNPHAGNNKSDDAGGGHAHAGAMIYLGDTWPQEYRGKIFMNNIHGQRLNMDVLTPRGSGFVGSHGPDFLLTQDRASQMLYMRYGPDANVYVIDWYDMQACHDETPDVHDRSNGRVYKIVYGDQHTAPANLKEKSDRELAELVLHQNDWYVRHARRLLQERAAVREIDQDARDRLTQIATDRSAPVTRQLRAMWALHAIGMPHEVVIRNLAADGDERLIAWAVRLAAENIESGSEPWKSWAEWPQLLERIARGNQGQPSGNYHSPIVRLAIASVVQRLPLEQRWPILEALTRHTEDADDHNLPLMYWYAAEPLAEADVNRALALGISCSQTIPLLRDFMLRRIASLDGNAGLPVLVGALGTSTISEEQLAILRAIRSSLSGQRHVEPPAQWKAVYRDLSKSDNEEVRREATALGVTFGDAAALEELRKLVASGEVDAGARRDALQALLAARDARLVETLYELLNDEDLRTSAISGLALYDDPRTAAKLLAIYPSLSSAEKRLTLATLSSRVPYGLALLNAVKSKQIPVADLPADLVRQLHNLKDEAVDGLLAEIWGQVRSTPEDKAALIAQYRKLLAQPPERAPDPQLGRAVFAKTCQQCHTLYGVGDTIGPDLTGSNRADAEYLLSNIVDPGALIAKEYQSTVIVMVDGRVVTGIVTKEDEKTLTVRTATETVVIPQEEIETRDLSELSLMPEDQLKQFSQHEFLSLIDYLRGRSQVPMLATKDNADLLFNGRDLTGWAGDSQLWSVENGEIVGRSPGLEHNSFLISDLSAENFRLSFDVKLVDDSGNSGVQFRSKALNGFHEVQGYQADIGPDWWGKLYEENGRAVLWDKSGERHVKRGEWNHYVIEALGNRIRTWINGQLCVDFEETAGERRGVFALQLHAGQPMEVRFKNLKLEVE
jgi:putative membrane-bound dehydrogenase-like protein